MARKIEIILVDDIDGAPAAETVLFGIDGSEYEIDLSAENAAALKTALARYTAAGRRKARSNGKSATRSRARKPQAASVTAIRRWAADNGYKISTRGRLPAPVVQAYEEALT